MMITTTTTSNKDVGKVQIIKRTGEEAFSPADKLLETGSIFVSGVFNSAMSHEFAHRLLYLNAIDGERQITIYVNSPGGIVHEGLGMIDLCRSVSNPIITVGWGLCASMGAVFLACAASRGNRYVLPTCEIMLHQPLGGAEGQVTDIIITAKHILGLKRRLTKMIALACGKPERKVAKDLERDRWFDAEDVVAYGLVDRVLAGEELKHLQSSENKSHHFPRSAV